MKLNHIVPQLFGTMLFKGEKMKKFKNWLITKLLEKDKLVCVPQSWHTEYVKLAAEKVRNNEIIATLMTEYNGLLKDYFNKCTVEEIQKELQENDIQFDENLDHPKLVEKAYEEFRMTIESD